MDNDSVYRNDGASFTHQLEEQIEKEIKDVWAQIPLLKAHLDYLDERVKFYSDVDSIPVDFNQNPEAHRNQVAVAKLMKGELIALREDVDQRVKAAAKAR